MDLVSPPAGARVHTGVGLGACLVSLFALTGCPDPEQKLADFADLTADERPNTIDESCESEADCLPGLICEGGACGECSDDAQCGDKVCGEGEIDGNAAQICQNPGQFTELDGRFHLVLSTVVQYSTPLQFVGDITVTGNSTDGGTIDMTLFPLSLNVGSTTEPRELLDEPIVLTGIEVDPGGAFNADLGVVMVTGVANPVTGGDITATIILNGQLRDNDFFCGQISGEVMAPIMSDLTPSFFAASRVAEDIMPPMGLPAEGEFPFRCPEDEEG